MKGGNETTNGSEVAQFAEGEPQLLSYGQVRLSANA